ncbi:hypothetical protein [Prosthecomicrobium hirschii]|uniref:hypothetical protein n=1 Tax=Prosthecodimorpha hirschii TaxID=665126 RepID=UPI00221FF5D4|nr:hypothetical protein [Prosthecomicrobium hirschii]MCW1842262.1 hypothetical protein [Prosthecomicrobium hirschii]
MWARVFAAWVIFVAMTVNASAQGAEDTGDIQGYGSIMAMTLGAECGAPLTGHGRAKAELFSYLHFARQGLSPAEAARSANEITARLRQEWPRLSRDRKAQMCQLLKQVAAGLNRVGE